MVGAAVVIGVSVVGVIGVVGVGAVGMVVIGVAGVVVGVAGVIVGVAVLVLVAVLADVLDRGSVSVALVLARFLMMVRLLGLLSGRDRAALLVFLTLIRVGAASVTLRPCREARLRY